MQMMPFNDKQIVSVGYNAATSELVIRLSTGTIRRYSAVRPDEYEKLLRSANPYDDLLHMTRRHDRSS